MNDPAGPSEAANNNAPSIVSGLPVKRKTGVDNQGIEYEKYMLLWVLMGLLEDPDVLEFYLADNVAGVGAFDDLVIRVKRKVPGKKDPVRQLICVQLKHKENTEKKITWQEVAGKSKGPYKLHKYYTEYKTSMLQSIGKFGDPVLDECLEDEITLVLYTNASFEFEKDSCDKNSYSRKLLESKNQSTVFDFNESTMNNGFSTELGKSNNEVCSEKQEIEKFLQKIIVFSNQCGIKRIKEKLTKKLRRYLSSENISLEHALQRAVEFIEQNNATWLSRHSGALYDITIMFQGVPVKLIELAAVFDRPYFKQILSEVKRAEREREKLEFMNKITAQYMALDRANHYVCVGDPLKSSEHYYVERGPVIKYRDRRFELQYSQEDKVLIESSPNGFDFHDEYILLICGGPGMGKSYYLTHQAKLLKDSTPEKFVIRVNLIDFSKYLGDLDINENHRIIAHKFLLEISGVAPGSASHDLFQACLRRNRMVIVFLDGLDEVSPDYYDKLIDIVKTINGDYDMQLWISTRPVVQERMEKDLEIRSWVLEQFSDSQATEFMEKYCPNGVDVFQSINMDLKTIPIFCKIFGDVIRAGSNINLQGLTNEVELYDAFVDVMFDVYNKDKKKCDVSILATNHDIQKHKRIAMEDHEKAALLEVFNEGQLSELKWKVNKRCKIFLKDIFDGHEKAGLIVNIVEGQPRFIHRTVAEYFCGRLLSKDHNKYYDYVKYHQYVKKNKKLTPKVDFFMSYKLDKSDELFKLILLKKYKEINKYSNSFVGELNIKDPLGRDLLYYVDNFVVNYYNYENFIKESYENKKYMYNVIGKFITEDMVQDLSSVSEVTRCFVNLNLLSSFLDSLDLDHRPIMVSILTCLLCGINNLNIDCIPLFLFNYCKKLPLHVSILANRDSNEFETLMSDRNINARDGIGLTPLHLAVILARHDVVKDLCEDGAQERRDNMLDMYPHQFSDNYSVLKHLKKKFWAFCDPRPRRLGCSFKNYLKILPTDKQRIFGKHVKDILIEIINNGCFTSEVEASCKAG